MKLERDIHLPGLFTDVPFPGPWSVTWWHSWDERRVAWIEIKHHGRRVETWRLYGEVDEGALKVKALRLLDRFIWENSQLDR